MDYSTAAAAAEGEDFKATSSQGQTSGYKISQYSAFDEAADVVARPSAKEKESREHLLMFKSKQVRGGDQHQRGSHLRPSLSSVRGDLISEKI